jgi:hypothetical protein
VANVVVAILPVVVEVATYFKEQVELFVTVFRMSLIEFVVDNRHTAESKRALG